MPALPLPAHDGPLTASRAPEARLVPTGHVSESVAQYDELNAVLASSPFGSDIQGSFIFCQGNRETYGPSLPILVLCHHAIPNTVYTSEERYGDYGRLVAEMQAYPRIIHVSGHSHAIIEDARSIDQSMGFICMQDSKLGAYFECERCKPHAMYDKGTGEVSSVPQTGADHSKASQCIVLDVMSSGRSVVTRYDLYPLMEGGEPRQLFEQWEIDPADMPYQKSRAGTGRSPSSAATSAATSSRRPSVARRPARAARSEPLRMRRAPIPDGGPTSSASET